MTPGPDPLDVEQIVARLPEIRERTAAIDEEKLETLLSLIEDPDTRVIPIVGQELITVPAEALPRPLPAPADPGKSRAPTLDLLLAQRLAGELRMSPEKMRADAPLTEVIAAHRPFMTDRKLIYKKLQALINSPDIAALPLPPPLLQLASIRDLTLFASTTWDTFLERAVDRSWYHDQNFTVVRSFSPYTPIDLNDDDVERTDTSAPVIFKMFGTVSEDPYYAATDADMIEFLHRFQYDKRPGRLLAELKNSHLLILGTNFPNWLARSFLRIIKDDELWKNREKNEYLADAQLSVDAQLVSFIRQYSRNTECFPTVTPTAFLERLHAEWTDRNPDRAVRTARPQPVAAPPRARKVQRAEECVFVSYASEDRPAANRIKQALEEMGWQVWFDRQELGSAELYEKTIEKAIRSAQACVIVLSHTTALDEPRFYKKEWAYALHRELDFTTLSRRYIHPVRIEADAPVPDEFIKFNVLTTPQGVPGADFLDDMKAILRQINKGKE